MSPRPMPPNSDRRERVQERFDAKGLGKVSDWLERKRSTGRSWVDISFDLRELIGLTVSYETLRRWSQNDIDESKNAEEEAT